MPTKIEWTDETWNPLIGCSRVAPGCDHCYAISVVHRQMSPQHIGLTVKREGEPTDWTGEIREVPHLLDAPLHWTRPRRIFVNSLSDLFHADVSDDYIARVFAVMALAPQHSFQVLTKRPQRMATLLASREFVAAIDDHRERLRPGCGDFVYPLPNVWLGTSIESDRYAFRADHLRRTPAAVRWVSAEPLLGPLPSLDLAGIDWVVAGGESGPGARPMHPGWARDLRDRCIGPQARPPRGVRFLFKQWGEWAPYETPDIDHRRPGAYVEPDGSWRAAHTALPSPDAWLVRRVGKKAAGRELDGREWNGYPDVTRHTNEENQ